MKHSEPPGETRCGENPGKYILEKDAMEREGFRGRADEDPGRIAGAALPGRNIGDDDLDGPPMLLPDPGRYFDGAIFGGGMDDAKLWILDLSAALEEIGGKLAAGATLAEQTVTQVQRTEGESGNSGQGSENTGLEGDVLPMAAVGEDWSAGLEAFDANGTRFYWQFIQAQAGMTPTPGDEVLPGEDGEGYIQRAVLTWTPGTDQAGSCSEITIVVSNGKTQPI
jgi:hypothetical protein